MVVRSGEQASPSVHFVNRTARRLVVHYVERPYRSDPGRGRLTVRTTKRADLVRSAVKMFRGDSRLPTDLIRLAQFSFSGEMKPKKIREKADSSRVPRACPVWCSDAD